MVHGLRLMRTDPEALSTREVRSALRAGRRLAVRRGNDCSRPQTVIALGLQEIDPAFGRQLPRLARDRDEFSPPPVDAALVSLVAEGLRRAALTWDDIDLEHRVISITKAVDKGTRIVSSTKSKVARRVPIEPNLMPLLEALYEQRDQSEDADPAVFWMPNHDERATSLREHLLRSGGREPTSISTTPDTST